MVTDAVVWLPRMAAESFTNGNLFFAVAAQRPTEAADGAWKKRFMDVNLQRTAG
jgi:hypothetical protein